MRAGRPRRRRWLLPREPVSAVGRTRPTGSARQRFCRAAVAWVSSLRSCHPPRTRESVPSPTGLLLRLRTTVSSQIVLVDEAGAETPFDNARDADASR